MKKLVSVLVLGSLASSVYAWTNASINYYQPIASYEAQNMADTNSSKNTDKAPEHKVQNDFKVVTNISGEHYSKEGARANNRDDSKEFQDIMLNDKFYALLLEENLHASEHASTVEFVMLMREMHRINHNLELILRQNREQSEMCCSSKIEKKASNEDMSKILKDGLKSSIDEAISDIEQQKKLIKTPEDTAKQGGHMDG